MTMALPMTDRPAALVPAVVRAVSVLDLLARERRPMSMAGLAAALNLPRSSVHGLCGTLLSCGYLRRADNGALLIGPGVMTLAAAFVASTHVAAEFDALWRETPPPDETLVLSVLNGADVVYIGVRNSARPLGLAFSLGMRLPAWITSTGKAMLSCLDPAEVRALVPPEATDVDALLAELAEARERGWAVDDGGVREGVYALAAPVVDTAGRPVAGIAFCINKAALDPATLSRQRELVIRAARTLSRRLGAREDTR
ncbi:IclR family transcriptional regulator [Rubrivivax gelatinosus]|nr:IclR family transcriptional regulator [Rubrivivax gelatinosus]